MKKFLLSIMFFIAVQQVKAQSSFTEERSSAWVSVTAVPHKTTTVKKPAAVKKKTAVKSTPVPPGTKTETPVKDAFDKTNSKVKRFKKG